MSFGTPQWRDIRRGLRYQFHQDEVRNFAGGLNLRDAPTELAQNESPDLLNVTLDERGGVQKRLGLNLLSNTLSNAPSVMFYSNALGFGLVMDGAELKKTTDFVTFTNVHAYSTSDAPGICEFNGKAIIVHKADGLASYDGTTFTAIAAGPKGLACVPWQNRVCVIGDPSHKTRVYASGTDETDWTVGGTGGAWTVDIEDHDAAPLTAIGAGQAIDTQAKPTLLVCKLRSMHRINDSATGAYQTIDLRAGAAGAQAITANLGRIVMMNDLGIWETDGLSAATHVSARIQPLFASTQINYSQLLNVVAGQIGDRVILSFPFGAAQSTNNYTFEYHPALGWITIHDFGLSSCVSQIGSLSYLYGARPGSGKVFNVFHGWDDDSAAISARFQTRWFTPNGDDYARMRRLRLFGRGSFSLYFKADFITGDGVLYDASFSQGGFNWNESNWNGSGVNWGPTTYEGYSDFYELGVCRSYALLFKESSTTSATGPSLLNVGAAPQIGSFAVYGFQGQYIPLGIS